MRRKIVLAITLVLLSFAILGCNDILYPKIKFDDSKVFMEHAPLEGDVVGHFQGIIKILPLMKDYVIISKSDEITCFYRISEDNAVIATSSVRLDFDLDMTFFDSVKVLDQGIYISHNYESKTSTFFVRWNEDEISTIYEITNKLSTRYFHLNLVDYIGCEVILVFTSDFSGSIDFPLYNTIFVKLNAERTQTAYFEISNNKDIPYLYLFDFILVDDTLFGVSRHSAADDLIIVDFDGIERIHRNCDACSEGKPLWYVDDFGKLNLFYIQNIDSQYRLVREVYSSIGFMPAQIVVANYLTESYTDFDFSNGAIYNEETQGLRMEHDTGDTFKSIILIDPSNSIYYRYTETINSLGNMIYLSERFITYNVLTGEIIEFEFDLE
jgi:hypothetical protein